MLYSVIFAEANFSVERKVNKRTYFKNLAFYNKRDASIKKLLFREDIKD